MVKLPNFQQFKVLCSQMFRRFFQILLALFLFTAQYGFAQLNNTHLETFQYIDSTKNQQLYFQFNSFSFLKNNEYFGKIADGFTLFGNQFSPKFIYQPAPNVSIEAGVYAWKDFGNDEFTSVQPIFTIKVQKDSSQFLFGNLDGQLNHHLVEPMLNFERVILNRQEFGIQYTKRTSKTFFDGWIDWQQMIYKGSDFQEKIFAGFSWNKRLIQHKNFKLSLPVQLTLLHHGGQITSSKDTSQVVTYTNVALGVEAELKTEGFFQRFKTQNYWLGYRQNSGYNPYFSEGSGIYLNLLAETKVMNLMLSYWQSSGFFAEAGGDLYQSVGRVYRNPNQLEKERKLLFFRFMKDWKLIDNLWLTFRFEPYFDLNNHSFEHSEGLFLTYRQGFKLK